MHLPHVKNTRLSSGVAKARPSSVTQPQDSKGAASSSSAQQSSAPLSQETTAGSSAQVPPDQPSPEELANAGMPLSYLSIGAINSVSALLRALDGGRDKSILRWAKEAGYYDGPRPDNVYGQRCGCKHTRTCFGWKSGSFMFV